MLTRERIQAIDRDLRIGLAQLTDAELSVVNPHNEAVDRNSAAIVAQLEADQLPVSALRTMKAADLKKLREGHYQRLFELLQERCALADDRERILEDLQVSFTKQTEATNKLLDSAFKDAEKGLAKLGITVESMPSAMGTEAARRKLDSQINEVPAVVVARRERDDAASKLRHLLSELSIVYVAKDATAADLVQFVQDHLSA